MSEPFLGEIRMFAGAFAPAGWAFCEGQLLGVTQNDALFSLVGTIYGGDGESTFGLPDLRGRVPIHFGSGPGLTPRQIGSKGGHEKVTLIEAQLPAHSHVLNVSTDFATESGPDGNILSQSTVANLYSPVAPSVDLASGTVTKVGGGQSHNNMMPSLGINFIIALFGIYPSPN